MSDTDGPTDESPGDEPAEETDDDRSTARDDGSPGDPAAGDGPDRDPTRRADLVTQDELDNLRQELDAFEEEIEDRTVHREELEGELKQYVRSRVRRGRARGWGPYLVLLYGTAMTIGAFALLSGGWAILAMLIVWLSTLGLYALMLVVGLTSKALGLPGRTLDRLRNLR